MLWIYRNIVIHCLGGTILAEEAKITEIVTTKKIMRTGNSFAVYISPWELDLLKIDQGDAVRITLKRIDN